MTTWKATERAVAARLGGRRVPITGRQRGDVPDVAHEWLSIEVKYRKKLPTWLREALLQAIAASDDGERLAVAILHEAGRRHDDDLVLCRLSDFRDWFVGEVENVNTTD